MNLYRLFLIFLSILLSSPKGHTFEVDNVTDRYSSLKDSRDILNDQVNFKFNNALKELNYGKKCDPKELQKAMYAAVSGHVVGSLENWADTSPQIDKHLIKKDNIYSKRGAIAKIRGMMLTAAGMNPSINLHGQYVGVDKLGHFFDQGDTFYHEFQKEKDPKKGLQRAIDAGRKEELGIYGQETTAIYSYADQAVNYAGMQFWNSLSSGAKPYFVCQNSQWVKVRDFDFADYVTAAWDEGINCNQYSIESFTQGVEKQEKFLESSPVNQTKKYRYTCPVSPNTCVALVKQYGANASAFIGPKCLRAKKTSEEGKVSGQTSARELGRSKYDEMPLTLKPANSSSKDKSEKGRR